VRRQEVERTIKHDPTSVVDLVLELQSKVQELEYRLNQYSQNSSMPPSSDPPLSRKERRAPKRKQAKRSKRNT